MKIDCTRHIQYLGPLSFITCVISVSFVFGYQGRGNRTHARKASIEDTPVHKISSTQYCQANDETNNPRIPRARAALTGRRHAEKIVAHLAYPEE
jgi:hypothetical protein